VAIPESPGLLVLPGLAALPASLTPGSKEAPGLRVLRVLPASPVLLVPSSPGSVR
jgi:hypothetical protein